MCCIVKGMNRMNVMLLFILVTIISVVLYLLWDDDDNTWR